MPEPIKGASDPVVVRKVQGTVEANIIQSLRESYGIHSHLASDISQYEFPFTVNGLGEVRLMVAREDEAEAREIVAEHLARREGEGGGHVGPGFAGG